jgi:hypothetical protein
MGKENRAGNRRTFFAVMLQYCPRFFDSVLSHWSLGSVPQRQVAYTLSKQPLVPSVLAKAGNVWRSPPRILVLIRRQSSEMGERFRFDRKPIDAWKPNLLGAV